MGSPIQNSYLRSYYYLVEEIGIAAIITSIEADNPVPNTFNVANTIARCFETSKIEVDAEENFELETVDYKLQNYPNPFNPSTTISFDIIDANSFVTVEIYNVKGQIVKQLGIANYELGVNQVIWNAESFSSGIYFYKLVVDGKLVDTKKMILMK